MYEAIETALLIICSLIKNCWEMQSKIYIFMEYILEAIFVSKIKFSATKNINLPFGSVNCGLFGFKNNHIPFQ